MQYNTMSANIYYEPTKRKKVDVPTMAPSSFMGTLERVFGQRTPKLNIESQPKLEALRDACEDEGTRKCYQVLIDGVERFDEIQLSAEY